MFNASYFTYDGVYSGDYGLQIASFDSQNVETTNVFAPTFKTMKSSRGKSFLHAGIKYEAAPTFDFQIISQNEIKEAQRREVLTWLVGRDSFKALRIHQDDLQDYSYRCVFSSVNIVYVNGRCHGFQVTATFDSWLCRGRDTVATASSSGDGYIEVSLMNRSDIIDDYVYPSIELTDVNSFGEEDDTEQFCSIVNLTDDASRETKFINLSSHESLTLDGETRMIINSNGLGRLSCFNKKWLRLKKGKNKLQIRINGTIKIKCPTYVMIGF